MIQNIRAVSPLRKNVQSAQATSPSTSACATRPTNGAPAGIALREVFRSVSPVEIISARYRNRPGEAELGGRAEVRVVGDEVVALLALLEHERVDARGVQDQLLGDVGKLP